MAKNIDQMIKDSPHRSMKKRQSFMGEKCPLRIFCQGTENLSYSFENLCRMTLERREMPNARCSA